MDFTTRKRLFNLCDPREPLSPGDSRYVDVDARGLRGQSLVESLVREIEQSAGPLSRFVAAVHGAGTSTELGRLAERLSRPEGTGYVVVRVDADAMLDLREDRHASEILLILLAAVEEELGKVCGEDPSKELRGRFVAELLPPSEQHDGAVLKRVARSLKLDRPLRDHLRRRLAGDPRFLNWVREELILLQDFACRYGYRGLIVVCDSLERLFPNRPFRPFIEAAQPGGWAHEIVLRWNLPVHLVATLPLALAPRLQTPRVRILPMIRIADRNDAPSAEGREVVREIVRRRIPDEILQDLLGHDIFEARLERLVERSAGWPMEIVRLLRALIAAGPTPLSGREFELVLGESRESYRRALSDEDLRRLASDGVRGALDPTNPATDWENAALLVSRGAALPYHDGGDWLGIHPGVSSLVRAATKERAPSPR